MVRAGWCIGIIFLSATGLDLQVTHRTPYQVRALRELLPAEDVFRIALNNGFSAKDASLVSTRLLLT